MADGKTSSVKSLELQVESNEKSSANGIGLVKSGSSRSLRKLSGEAIRTIMKSTKSTIDTASLKSVSTHRMRSDKKDGEMKAEPVIGKSKWKKAQQKGKNKKEARKAARRSTKESRSERERKLSRISKKSVKTLLDDESESNSENIFEDYIDEEVTVPYNEQPVNAWENEEELRLKLMGNGLSIETVKALLKKAKDRKKSADGNGLLLDDYTEQLLKDLGTDDDSWESKMSIRSRASADRFNSIQGKTDFLLTFDELPDMTDVVSVAESNVSHATKSSSDEEKVVDHGHFVDPLTGVTDSSSKTDLSGSEPMKAELLSVAEEEVEIDESDLEVETTQRPITEVAEIKEDVDALDALRMLEKSMLTIDDTDNEAKLEASKNMLALRQLTLHFIYELFNEVVDLVETRDEPAKLAASLDKKKLWFELKNLCVQHEDNSALNRQINRKLVEHHKRNKNLRVIEPLEPNVETAERMKYEKVLRKLDKAMKTETIIKANERIAISSATENLTELKTTVHEQELQFDELIRKTMARRNFDNMKRFVDKELATMAQKRDEISQIRMILIYRQHALAKQQTKMNELEHIGDELRMTTFIHMQTETHALGRKVEERNTELNRLFVSCNTDLHVLAHMTEKLELMNRTLRNNKVLLSHLRLERKGLREQMFAQKLIRGKIRNEMSEISYNGGLLDKPLLMFDFDHTLDKVKTLKERVNRLRQVHMELTRKIHDAEVLDCEVSDWGEWSDCDKSCGTGMMTRVRKVQQAAKNGGKHCPSLVQNRGCQGYRCHGHPDKNTLHEIALLLPAAFSHNRHANDSNDIRRNLRSRSYRDSYKHNRKNEYCVEFEVLRASKSCHNLPPYNLMLEGDRISVRCDLEALVQDSVPVLPPTKSPAHASRKYKSAGSHEQESVEASDDEAVEQAAEETTDEEENVLDTGSDESNDYDTYAHHGTGHHSMALGNPDNAAQQAFAYTTKTTSTTTATTTTTTAEPTAISYHCRGEGLAGHTTRWNALPMPSCRGKWVRLTVGPPKKCQHAQFIFI